jgi:hypothetical protein
MEKLMQFSKGLDRALGQRGAANLLPTRRSAVATRGRSSKAKDAVVFVGGTVLKLLFVVLFCVGAWACGSAALGAWRIRAAKLAESAELRAAQRPSSVESELEAFLEHEAGEATEMRGVLSAVDTMRRGLAGNITRILHAASHGDGDPSTLAERLTHAVEVVYGEINRHVDPLVAELRNESGAAEERLRLLQHASAAQDDAAPGALGIMTASDVEFTLRCFVASVYSHFKRYGKRAPRIDPLIRETDITTLRTALARLGSGEWKAWEAKLAFDNGHAFRTGFPSYVSWVDDPDEPTVDEMVTYTSTMLGAARFRQREYDATRLFHRWSSGKVSSVQLLDELRAPSFADAIPLSRWLFTPSDDIDWEVEGAEDGCRMRARALGKQQ